MKHLLFPLKPVYIIYVFITFTTLKLVVLSAAAILFAKSFHLHSLGSTRQTERHHVIVSQPMFSLQNLTAFNIKYKRLITRISYRQQTG